MKKSIYKVISYIIIIAIVIVVYIYVDEEVYGYIENLAIDDSIEKEEDLVVDENENQIENCVVEGDSEDMELTKEYVCSEFGIDEAEFEGVDFEDFVDYYDLSYDTIHREAVAYLLERYKEDLEKVKIPDYHSIYNYNKDIILTKENQNDISIIFLAINMGEENQYIIFDFDIEKIIISGSDSAIPEKDVVGIANVEVREQIVGLFEKYSVYSWRMSDNKKLPNDSGVYDIENWAFRIKFNNGDVYGVGGRLLDDEYAPEDMDLFAEELKTLATSSQN